MTSVRTLTQHTHAAKSDRTFPVSHSVLAPDALRAILAGTYKFRGEFRCELIRAGMNDTYLVTTRNARYVARVYRAGWRSMTEIAYELDLLVHLARQGVNVAAPLEARDGQFVHLVPALEGTRQLVVFNYAAGVPLTWTNGEHCYRAGRLLASIHEASDTFMSPYARAPLNFHCLIERPLADIRPFLARRPPDLGYLTDFAARRRAELEAVGPELEWGVCHGDFSTADNFRVADDRMPTIFDFDLCGPGWRISDLAPIRRVAIGHENPRIWREFLRGYTEKRPLARADLAAVPLFHVIGQLWSMGMRAANVKRWGAILMGDWYIDWQLKAFRQWERDMLARKRTTQP